MMPDRNAIYRRLSSARDDLFRHYPIRRLGQFGSFARGDVTLGSNIDILVEFSEPVRFETSHILVADMLEAVERILSYTQGLTYGQFVADEKTSNGVLYKRGPSVKLWAISLRKPCLK